MEKEKRVFDFTDIEIRELPDGETRQIDGYAATYGNYSQDLGGFIEIIERGFFDEVLENDVLSLWNHNSDKPLGRTSSGTLSISSDIRGLHTVTDVANTTWGNDAIISIKRGDVKQMSFAFGVKQGGDKWEQKDGVLTRTLLPNGCARLYDISPVSYPAYVDTEVSARALDKVKELTNTQAGDNKSQPSNGRTAQERHAAKQRQLDILKLRNQ